MSSTEQDPAEEDLEEIAIIGMAGRFPGAADLDQFWRNLCGGVESICFFSAEEALAAGVDPELVNDPRYVRARGVLDGVELFDAAFFGLSPREAAITDPQHRVLLECAWEALEAAGYDGASWDGRIGVYAGTTMSTYLLSNLLDRREDPTGSWQIGILNDKDVVATRISYKLNLKGPSLTVQSACSTSLVAVHLARQSLLDYECDMALAGGVTIRIPQKTGHLYHLEGFFSSDGRCRPFDARASGVVFGCGAGVVVCRRLEDALTDGDNVLAVIRGSAINNDGSLKVGFTAPSLDGQAEVIGKCLEIAGVDPATVGYVEAHGTGTAVGDQIEIGALVRAYGAGAARQGSCALGALKANVGHLDSAAGVAGLIKTVLVLQNRRIPPTLHFEKPGAASELASGPFFVNTELRNWDRGPTPRRAGVSAFGIGGTNAHLILEEPPPPPPAGPSRPWQLLVLSAQTPTALERMTENLIAHLGREPAPPLADVAYTLQLGRRRFAERRMLVCRNREEALEILDRGDPERLLSAAAESDRPAVAFMFPGWGPQHVDMGRELYATEAVFRDAVDRCAEHLGSELGCDLRELLYPPEEKAAAAAERIDDVEVAPPALFVVEYALARLFLSWGVRPQAMIGYSTGEYVAAHLAGVMTLEDALDLVVLRCRLIGMLPPAGGMLAVPLSEAEIASRLGSELSLAAVSGPTQCVVSGPVAAVDELEASLEAEGVECHRLGVVHGYHSAMLKPTLPAFLRRLAAVPLQPPQIPYVANVTGTWVRPVIPCRPWPAVTRNAAPARR